MYYIYMLRCKDDSIYTGITVDLKQRMQQHFSGDSKSAKYVLSRGAKRLEAVWRTEEKGSALSLEARIKKLTRQKKENVISDKDKFAEYFSEKIDCSLYSRILLEEIKEELQGAGIVLQQS